MVSKLFILLIFLNSFKQQLCIFSQKISNKNKQQLYKIQKRPTGLFYHVLLIKQNECSCSNMIWTFRIFITFLFALCVEAHLNKVHAKKGPPEVKKFWELYNDKKIKYRLGLCFCWMMSILFKIKFFVCTNCMWFD